VPISIQHFSDVLCVFAYIAQARLDELTREFGEQIAVDFHFCQIFDDTERKIAEGWKDRGGFAGYGAHVAKVASAHPHLHVHPRAWLEVRPLTSLSAHLFLHAMGVLEQRGDAAPGSLERSIAATRRAFFEQARDISRQSELLGVAEELGVAAAALELVLERGEAQAALARDISLSRQLQVGVSPTLIFNEGRQRLTGNVGFRILEANVRELLRAPEHEASWC